MDLSNYMKKEGRALPVFLLVDVSGSMRGEKIETVNVALKEMLNTFKKIENPKGVIELSIIAFGNGKAQVIKPLSKIADLDQFEFTADGNTPMGMAFESVAELIEDYSVVSRRAYTPTIVLISDGNPTDFSGYNANMPEDDIYEWAALKQLQNGERSSKATRLAMGIGSDVDNCFKYNCYNLVEIAHKLLKTTNIDENNFINLFNKSNLSYKKMLYVYLLEEKNRINYSEYLISIKQLNKRCARLVVSVFM